MCYDYRCSYAQGDFSTSGRQTPSSLVLELYHPVWVIVKRDPEEVAFVHGCKEHLVSFALLNDTVSIVPHHVSKAVLCFLGDGCDCCGLHDLNLDVCNLVGDAGLVEIMCATRCSGTSRRVSRTGSRLGLEQNLD